ncbi:MAG: protease complex subunit PrcB family protein [Gemmatimonadetes bacterium]|nr:protease complex subunit PrcB family protein [Gemmatimonadota bacterium]
MYAQIDTADVHLPVELSAFCRRGTTSMRQAGAPPAAGHQAGEPVPASTLYKDPHIYLGQPVRCVVRREEDWVTLWSAIKGAESPPPPLPPFDFDRGMLLVAGMGPRPTTGYSIEILEVRRTGAELVAVVVQHTPGGCEVGMGFTEPVHAVAVPHDDAPVAFIEKIRDGPSCRE